ncbi:hypothetical protein [Aquitalea pelogenes]|uniref:hypothetical protein n=1 Tax=Aquitalea pelogenes TaxID=1293573 RepID=UPI0035B4D8F5
MTHDINTILQVVRRFTTAAIDGTDWTHTTTTRNNTIRSRFLKPYVSSEGKMKHNGADGYTVHFDDGYPTITYNDPRTRFMFKKNDQELELKLWSLLTNTHTNNKGENHE